MSAANLSRQSHGLFDGIDEDRQGPVLRAALGAVNLLYCREIEWIGRERVERVRRHANHFTAPDESGRVADRVVIRCSQ